MSDWLPTRVVELCRCGHSLAQHDGRDGTARQLCAHLDLIDGVNCPCIDYQLGRWHVWWTNAPRGYDGFKTFTTRQQSVAKSIGAPLPWREVVIMDEHLTWQRDRYRSGLYELLTIDEYEHRIVGAARSERNDQ